MRCNVGKSERLIRLGAALALFAAAAAWSWLFAVAGAVILVTVIIGWCPLSALLGVSTCKWPETLPADTVSTPKDARTHERRFK